MERPVRKASALRFVGSLAAFAVAGGALTGCEQPGAAAPVAPTEASAPTSPAAPAPVVVDRETDLGAFDLTESTYWDGRPSLGGLWVAHPLVDKPMRVRIINQDTGESADGALFRRDAALPGPPILLSYDAAKAIGVKPGVLTQIRVVALKSEETQKAEAAAAEAAITETAAKAETTQTAAAPTPEPAAPEAPAEAPAKETAPAPAATAVAAAAPAETAPAVATPPATVAKTPAKQPVAPAATPKTPKPEVAAEPAKKLNAPAEPAPETPAATAEEEEKPFATAVAAALSDETPKPEAPAAPALKNRFIQIATFKLAVNAEKTAEEFRVDDVPAEVRQGLAAGEKRMSRVLLGPFDEPSAQSEAMRKARARGFKDAYYVDK